MMVGYTVMDDAKEKKFGKHVGCQSEYGVFRGGS